MKLSRIILFYSFLIASLGLLQSCALFSGDEDDQVDELGEEFDEEAMQEGDEEMAQGEEGGAEEGMAMGEEMEDPNIGNVNSLGGNDGALLGAEGLGIPDNIPADGGIADGGIADTGIAGGNEIAGMNELNAMMAETPPSALNESAPIETIPEAPMEEIPTNIGTIPDAPVAAPSMSEIAGSDARVFYVLTGGAQLLDSPGGSSVGNLPQGEPCLAKIEGDYANIINRGYVAISQLSPDPVGRGGAAVSWQ